MTVLVLLQYLGLLAVAVAIGVVGYRVLRLPKHGLRGPFDVRFLGRIEGSVPGLKRVIVIADRVEDPKDELRAAVERNLRKGVQYDFLISKSRAQHELAGYYKIFAALAEIVTERAASDEAVDLVRIRQLPFDWPDYPYVFYECAPDGTGRTTYIAFRGNQLHEGIAEEYYSVPPHFARTIAVAVLSGAPEPIEIRPEGFEAPSNVIPISSVRASS